MRPRSGRNRRPTYSDSLPFSSFVVSRRIMHDYNQHVRLLSPSLLVWLSTTNFTRVSEPTLSCNQLRSLTLDYRKPISMTAFSIKWLLPSSHETGGQMAFANDSRDRKSTRLN